MAEIDSNPGTAYDEPRVVIDSAGSAIAVWVYASGSRYDIWANRYTQGTGWIGESVIENVNTGSALAPEIAVDNFGNALVVWQHYDYTADIWSNRFVAGVGWGTAEVIGSGFNTDNDPAVATDSLGNGIAVWAQHDAAVQETWAGRYTAGVGWAVGERIESGVGNIDYPQIAIDGNGNAIAVWEQYDGTRTNIRANRYIVGSGWGTDETIELNNAGAASRAQVCVDDAGNAIAAWRQDDGSKFAVWANRYTVNIGWGTAGEIGSSPTGNSEAPRLACDEAGNALAVWQQWESSTYNIRANTYQAGVGWLGSEVINSEPGFALSPALAMNASGTAVAVWEQAIASEVHIWSNHFTVADGWQSSSRPVEDYGVGSNKPDVAINGSGIAQAVWVCSSDGVELSICTSRYSNP